MARKVKKILLIFWNSSKIFLKLFAFLLLCMSLVGVWVLSKIPSDKEIKGCLTTEMYQVNLCPGSSGYVSLGRISSNLQKAVILTEDGSFWQHNGFDFQELENSFRKNLEKGRFARGGSTISQQLAKNMFLSKEKTLSRKGIEALITLRIEKVLSKREILERYLNVVQFGKNIFGVKQASQFYFKKHPSELSVLESAYLAFLLPSPEIYSKSFYKKKLTPFASKRLTEIVDKMYRYNHIGENDYLASKAQLEYFLTGEEPPIVDPSVDELNEEEALDDFE